MQNLGGLRMNDKVINEVTERLKALGIRYELDEHEAVFTIEAIIALGLNKKGVSNPTAKAVN